MEFSWKLWLLYGVPSLVIGIVTTRLMVEPAPTDKMITQSYVLEERAKWEKDCKAQVQKELEKCGNTPLLNRCCDAGKVWMEDEMSCQTSLQYNKRKLRECQDKVIKYMIDERGI
jgi:hypothetical protein